MTKEELSHYLIEWYIWANNNSGCHKCNVRIHKDYLVLLDERPIIYPVQAHSKWFRKDYIFWTEKGTRNQHDFYQKLGDTSKLHRVRGKL
jgi:hypothetical protein